MTDTDQQTAQFGIQCMGMQSECGMWLIEIAISTPFSCFTFFIPMDKIDGLIAGITKATAEVRNGIETGMTTASTSVANDIERNA